MRYVIIRDDDTNALTPVECLEQLYRPFLERGLSVNLAVIPDVATNAARPDGNPEGFLFAKNGTPEKTLAIASNTRLVEYLRGNPLFHIVQHGCHHDPFEFDRESRDEISRRIEHGTHSLADAGFAPSETFVAPHDRLSRASFQEVAKRFAIISSGWYELRRLPVSWWPQYATKKIRHAPHWRVNGTLLLSHPGCLLSRNRRRETMIDDIARALDSQQLTVLVTHWWEYFPGGAPDESFIARLHETADYLARLSDLKVISFSHLARGLSA